MKSKMIQIIVMASIITGLIASEDVLDWTDGDISNLNGGVIRVLKSWAKGTHSDSSVPVATLPHIKDWEGDELSLVAKAANESCPQVCAVLVSKERNTKFTDIKWTGRVGYAIGNINEHTIIRDTGRKKRVRIHPVLFKYVNVPVTITEIKELKSNYKDPICECSVKKIYEPNNSNISQAPPLSAFERKRAYDARLNKERQERGITQPPVDLVVPALPATQPQEIKAIASDQPKAIVEQEEPDEAKEQEEPDEAKEQEEPDEAKEQEELDEEESAQEQSEKKKPGQEEQKQPDEQEEQEDSDLDESQEEFEEEESAQEQPEKKKLGQEDPGMNQLGVPEPDIE